MIVQMVSNLHDLQNHSSESWEIKSETLSREGFNQIHIFVIEIKRQP